MIQEERGNEAGVVSFVFGLLSICFALSVTGALGGVILAALGIIFGFVQIRNERNSWAIWGIIFSIVGLIANLILIIFLIKAAYAVKDAAETVVASVDRIEDLENVAELVQEELGGNPQYVQ